MNKRECCGCGARQYQAMCPMCLRDLPASLRQLVRKAMFQKFSTVDQVTHLDMAVACVEGVRGFWRRLES